MELRAQMDVVADMGFQAVDAVGAQDEPDLEGAEAAAEGDLPVAVVGDEAGVGEVVAEVGGGDGEGVGEVAAAFDVEAAVGSRCQKRGWGGDRLVVGRCRYLASKFVNSHLCMLMSKLSIASKGSVRCWYSSQTNAPPAYAASTCIHTSGQSLPTSLISSNRSVAQVAVVPRLAVKKNGSSFCRLHSSNIFCRPAPVSAKSSSVLHGIDLYRTPAMMAAFAVLL